MTHETEEQGSLKSNRRKLILVGVAGVLIVVASVFAVQALSGDDGKTPSADVGLPGVEDDVASNPDEDGSTMDPAELATLTPTPLDEATAPGRIAYRLDGGIWVADEDGSNPVYVAESAEGPFALSPDGQTLAYADELIGHLFVVVEVETPEDRDAGLVDLGAALMECPSWAPDSSWFAFTADTPAGGEVSTALRNGNGVAAIGAGRGPSVSIDAKRIAYIDAVDPGAAGPIQSYTVDTGSLKSISGPPVIEVAWLGGFILYSSTGADGVGPSLATVSPLGVNHKELVGAPMASRPVLYTRLCVSPDGAHVSYAHSGDDGYSRTFVIEAESPTPFDLSIRRDSYPLCWTSDSSRLFFVEGNAFQGEDTDLMSVQPDGLGRRIVVEGAGL
ncbi:MAG: hypothetical protein PF636_07755 [Actinomycetota bacterium]|nr:hypothetical protein [Actinomycetota bacterium]